MNKTTPQEETIVSNKKIAMRVSTISIMVNLGLSLLKFIAGIVAHSGAMISDAVHSASDVLSTFVVIIGVNISSRKPDEGHQYGHDRLECVAAILLAAILFITGLTIGWNAVEKIRNAATIETPGVLALAAAAISIGVKEWMYWYTRSAAKKINSSALEADAWHHRSDALSSIGSLVGIAGARLGFPILDPIAAIVIAALVVKVAIDIGKDSINRMLDSAIDEQTEEEIRKLVLAQPGVDGVDDLRTRTFGASFYVDLEIAIDGEMKLRNAHDIAESVHAKLEKQYPTLKHCMIHINPTGVGSTH